MIVGRFKTAQHRKKGSHQIIAGEKLATAHSSHSIVMRIMRQHPNTNGHRCSVTTIRCTREAPKFALTPPASQYTHSRIVPVHLCQKSCNKNKQLKNLWERNMPQLSLAASTTYTPANMPPSMEYIYIDAFTRSINNEGLDPSVP